MHGWQGLGNLHERRFVCGSCDTLVSSDRGFHRAPSGQILICPGCGAPTYFDPTGKQIPGVAAGQAVAHLPDDIKSIYDEARKCIAAGSFTAAVLACRKLLMNIAVSKGAPEGKPFITYVEYLAEKGYVPPDGRVWVDHIRQKGNEANHEIKLMEAADAEDLITFSEMLLKLIFEFPRRVPARPAAGS